MIRWFRRLILVACGVGVSLGAAELAVREFADVSPPLTEIDPVVGLRGTPGFAGEVFQSEVQKKISVRFNSEGFRGPEWASVHPAAKRVAIFGDSMVAGLAVDESATTAGQLANELGPGWESMNWGVVGSSPATGFATWRAAAKKYSPNVVVAVFFVGNDLSDNCRRLDNFPRIYFDVVDGTLVQLPNSTARSAASRWLNRHSRFYVWQKEIVNRAGKSVSRTASRGDTGAWVYATAEPRDVAHAWDITAAIFQAWNAEVRASGGDFLVAILPESAQLVPERLSALALEKGASFDATHPETRISAMGVPYVALRPAFEAVYPELSPPDRAKRLFLNGHGHLTASGHQIAARAIAQRIQEMGVAGAPEGNEHQSAPQGRYPRP